MASFRISFGSKNQSPDNSTETIPQFADSSSIDEDERGYYQPDDYYVLIAHPGTVFEKRVIPFEERCKSTFPSKRGLHVAEILLLHYCSLGDYPKPKKGYPSFWWFEYGIRDVGHALISLAEKGFLTFPIEKNEKYELTEIGTAELEENAYVPYMHKHGHKTTEDKSFGETFTVWDINQLLHGKDIGNWRIIVGDVEKKRFGVNIACGEKKKQRKKESGIEEKYSTEEMRQFLIDNKDRISKEARKPGNGLEEELKGIDLKKIGEDKEALFNFYVSISKGFDAPALYSQTMILLRKYNLLEEELAVCKAAMRAIPNSNKHKEELEKRMKKIEEKLNK